MIITWLGPLFEVLEVMVIYIIRNPDLVARVRVTPRRGKLSGSHRKPAR
jgi:hypothetical protein